MPVAPRGRRERRAMESARECGNPDAIHANGDAGRNAVVTLNSPKRLARIAGVLYLLVAIFGGFAQGFVYPKIYAASDAATTAGNVVANAGLVRIGVVADLVQATVFVFLAITLYRLLKHVHSSAALAMVVLVAIVTGITCLNAVFAFEGLHVETDKSYLDAVGTGGSNALVLLLFAIQLLLSLIHPTS
jgi:hypothetical protein